MHKNLILFSDGTGNSPAKLARTNVWRVYKAVDLTDPPNPKEPRQFAFYDNGVGSSSWKPLALLGGAFGAGLARNVRDLYKFVCRTYQPGDKIFAFGFSRGAFTIGVVLGLLLDQGLVPYIGNETDLDRYARDAYRAYRKRYLTPFLGPLRQSRDAFLRSRDRFFGRQVYNHLLKIGAPHSEQPIGIAFVGLWDTVDAYGLPIDELTRAIDKTVWPMKMREPNLDPRVKIARHALSLDDERNTFHPLLWNEEPNGQSLGVNVLGDNHSATHIDQERISQVWFAGVHADVGGGYPDEALSYVSLNWMMNEAAKYGIRFSPKIWDEYRALSDENGPMHDSRHGLGGYYRYNPRRIEKLTNRKDIFIKRAKIHESALRRIRVGQDAYAPIVLPQDFDVVQMNGSIVPCVTYLQTTEAKLREVFSQTEEVWNLVWRRRVVYFFTLFTTVLLALTPLKWRSASSKETCTHVWCFISDLTSYGMGAAKMWLPEFSVTWTEGFSLHPLKFLFLTTLIAMGLWYGGRLEQRIRDTMRPLWYSFPTVRPHHMLSFSPTTSPEILNQFIQWLRTHHAYRVVCGVLNQYFLPYLALIGAFYLGGATINSIHFGLAASSGIVCQGTNDPKPVLNRQERGRPFRTNSPCSPTGFFIFKGQHYRLLLRIPASQSWKDNSIPAGPKGVRAIDETILMDIAVPFRRRIAQPWFKPIARIGAKGSDEYPLDFELATHPIHEMSQCWNDTCSDPFSIPEPTASDDIVQAEFVAQSSGELFLYVNDVVLLPPWTTFHYRNNIGSADVILEAASPT